MRVGNVEILGTGLDAESKAFVMAVVDLLATKGTGGARRAAGSVVLLPPSNMRRLRGEELDKMEPVSYGLHSTRAEVIDGR